MTSFKISDMTCGHCAGTVEKAVKAVDAGARVQVDLDSKRVDIDSAVPAGRFADAIRNAGYTPQPQA